LDVQTLAVLEEYLEDFSGCVIVVSHDRYFLDRTVDTIFALEALGKIRQYPGNYSVYLDYKKAEEEKLQPTTKIKEIETPQTNYQSKENKKRRGLSTWEKREFEQLEGKIAQLEVEKAEVEKALGSTPPGNYTQVQKLYEQVEALKQAIDVATERWMELAEVES
jgi:ATP-binding cassette subfamily F protein uup